MSLPHPLNAARMNVPAAHVIVSTHTPRHLDRVLTGLGHQRQAAATIVISTDNDSAEIAAVVSDHVQNHSTETVLVQRPFAGIARSAQVRNNGVRALMNRRPHPGSILVFLDGDCVPSPDLLVHYQRLCGRGRLALGFRIDLTESQTERFDAAELADGREPIKPTPEQLEQLHRRALRAKRHALLRRSGLAKPHKPKLLSANFAVSLADYAAVNGFDEQYEGYGQEDDDFGRRLYRAGCRPIIAISLARVYHLFHPTRAPRDWHESPNAKRFAADGPTRCEKGLDDPLHQAPVTVRTLSSRERSEAATASTR